MPDMGMIDEDDVFHTISVHSIEEAETELGGRVQTILIESDVGMYVLESAASKGYRVNHAATYLYSLANGEIRKIFGPVLIFGRIDSCGNHSADPQDMPNSAYRVIMGNVFETILMT